MLIKRLNAVLTASVIMLLLVGCVADKTAGPAQDLTPETGADTGQSDPGPVLTGLPDLPADEYIPTEQILAHRGSIAAELVLTGNQYYLADADANANDEAGTCYLAAASPDRCWVMYRFENLIVADYPDLLTIELDTLPAEYLIAWSDYGTNSWAWTYITTPTDEDSIPLPAGVAPVSPGGNVYALFAVTDNRQATVSGIKLALDADAPPPVGLQAGDGTRGDMIQLSWTDLAVTYPGLSYTGVKVYRAEYPRGPWTELDEVATGVTDFEDIHEGTGVGQNNIPYNQTVYYRLRTVTETITGAPGLSDAGLRVLDDVTGLSATDGEHYDKVVITWSYVRDDADGYEVAYKETSQGEESWTVLAQVSGYTTQSFEHTDASPAGKECAYNTSYDYRVKAVYLDNESLLWSNVDSGMRVLFPPSNESATDGDYTDKIRLTWTRAVDATGYKVFRDGITESDLVATLDDVAQWDDYTLSDNLDHSYYLSSTNVGAGLESELSPAESGYVNAYPVADLVASPTFGSSPLTVYFDASGSSDDHGIVSYEWDWNGDGAYDHNSGTDPIVDHEYNAGEYTVVLRVTDENDLTDTSSETIEVDVWAHTWGESSGDEIYSVEISSNGNLCWSGSTQGHVLVGIVSPLGSLSNVKEYSIASSGASAFGITCDDSNSVYVGGTCSNGVGGGDAFLLKCDSTGSASWGVRWGTALNDTTSAVITDNSAVYSVGHYLSGSNYRLLLLIHSTTDGSLSQAKSWRPSEADDASGNAVCLDGSGNLYIAGSVDGQAGTGSISDFAILKLNSSAVSQWQASWGQAAVHETALGIANDGSSNVYVAGYGQGSDYATILKISDSGVLQRAKRFEGPGKEVFTDVVLDPSGSLFAVGYCSVGDDEDDCLVVKLSPAGDLLGAVKWGRVTEDHGVSIASDTTGQFYVGGTSYAADGTWSEVSGSLTTASGTFNTLSSSLSDVTGTADDAYEQEQTGFDYTEDTGGGGGDCLALRGVL